MLFELPFSWSKSAFLSELCDPCVMIGHCGCWGFSWSTVDGPPGGHLSHSTLVNKNGSGLCHGKKSWIHGTHISTRCYIVIWILDVETLFDILSQQELGFWTCFFCEFHPCHMLRFLRDLHRHCFRRPHGAALGDGRRIRPSDVLSDALKELKNHGQNIWYTQTFFWFRMFKTCGLSIIKSNSKHIFHHPRGFGHFQGWRCSAVCKGHGCRVWDALLAPNDDEVAGCIVTASEDSLVRIFSMQGALLRELQGRKQCFWNLLERNWNNDVYNCVYDIMRS